MCEPFGVPCLLLPNPLPLCLHPCPLQSLGLLTAVGFLSVGVQVGSMLLLSQDGIIFPQWLRWYGLSYHNLGYELVCSLAPLGFMARLS